MSDLKSQTNLGLRIVRSGQEAVVVNLDIASPEDETDAVGSDPFHSNAP